MIYILNGFNVVDAIETKRSVIWNEQYNGLSELELVVPGTDVNIDKLIMGRYLVREEDVTEDGFKNVMIINDIKLTFDTDEGWLLTIHGNGLKSLLKRRVIWTQTNLHMSVEVGIRQVVTENVINPSDTDRKIDDFILDSQKSLPGVFECQCFGENLADWIQETCETYNYGWDVFIKNNKYVFSLYKGADRSNSITFSQEYDNLLGNEYEYNREEYKNAALIGGEGEGTDQRFASIGTATGLNRFETYIDGSDVSSNGEIITLETYIELLKEFGKQELAQTAITQTFTGEIVADGLYKLNEDYFLGDIVHVKNNKGIEADARITEIIYSEDENGITILPTFSEWEVES